VTVPAFLLPERLRRFFAWPRGLVYSGDFTGLLEGSPVACIGDVVSRYCARTDVEHLVLVVDGKTRRSQQVEGVDGEGFRVVGITNPRGSLSFEAYEAMCRVLREQGRWLVTVEGEEDMVALAALACTPAGGTVVYGVPGVGATIIRVMREVSREAQSRLLVLHPSILSD